MATSRIYTKEWQKFFKTGKNISANTMFGGNFYKIVVYRYADPAETKVLSGLDTAFIFLLGKFRTTVNNKSQMYLPAIKLKNVNPGRFFEGLKMAFDSIDEAKINETEEFRFLLRKFPNDGRPLFSLLKKKPLIYNGNYREYKMSSIKSVELLDFDRDYVKVKTIPGYSNQAKIEEEKKLKEPQKNPDELKLEKKAERVLKDREISLKEPPTLTEQFQIVEDVKGGIK